MQRIVSFIVTVELPSGVSPSTMRRYIEDEVKANIGQLSPEDPLFHLNQSAVQVAIVPNIKDG